MFRDFGGQQRQMTKYLNAITLSQTVKGDGHQEINHVQLAIGALCE